METKTIGIIILVLCACVLIIVGSLFALGGGSPPPPVPPSQSPGPAYSPTPATPGAYSGPAHSPTPATPGAYSGPSYAPAQAPVPAPTPVQDTGICPANTYSSDGSSGMPPCDPCPANSTSVSGSRSLGYCTCKSGYYQTSGSCRQCTQCPSVSNGSSSQQGCISDVFVNGQLYQAGNPGTCVISCNPGYTLTNGTCVPCATNQICTSCGLSYAGNQQYWNGTACVQAISTSAGVTCDCTAGRDVWNATMASSCGGNFAVVCGAGGGGGGGRG